MACWGILECARGAVTAWCRRLSCPGPTAAFYIPFLLTAAVIVYKYKYFAGCTRYSQDLGSTYEANDDWYQGFGGLHE